MRKIKLIICSFIIGISCVSCDDFLTLLPLNEVVLENYWTEKSDVESVLYGTYAALEKEDCVFRMSMWGEMRSDNIMAGSNPAQDILNITKDNIIETNKYTSWSCFYDVINRANTILSFAPSVQAKDPNYSVAELRSNQAEAIALRSLCYWYLIRAYRDVPFVTKPSIDDSEEFKIPATKFDVILDRLITELDSVKDFAVNRYVNKSGYTADQVTRCRITRASIYAMLADMYLWKGDWEKCMECSDFVIKRKQKEYKDIYSNTDDGKYDYLGGKECIIRPDLFNDIPLINQVGSSDSKTETGGRAYDDLFGSCFSFESLFELANDESNDKTNDFVKNNYISSNNGSLQNIGNLAPTKDLQDVPDDADKTVLFKKSDVRYYESMRELNSNFGISKYSASSVRYRVSSIGDISGTSSISGRNNDQPNWIIYRLTDVVLMKAEAEVLLAKDRPDLQDSLLKDAFNLTQAVYIRSNYGLKATDSRYPKQANYSTIEKMDDFIFNERRRELLFEGKRWFDLVRRARRAGNTDEIASLLASKHLGSNATFATKIKDMNYIYFPINKDELKLNPQLKQNPAYKLDDKIEKN